MNSFSHCPHEVHIKKNKHKPPGELPSDAKDRSDVILALLAVVM